MKIYADVFMWICFPSGEGIDAEIDIWRVAGSEDVVLIKYDKHCESCFKRVLILKFSTFKSILFTKG